MLQLNIQLQLHLHVADESICPSCIAVAGISSGDP
jgi:hypothetical protein